jgi:hypothetical protein
MIQQQSRLKREEILERIEKLSRSLRYDHEREIIKNKKREGEDTRIPKLLAQEMNVDLGDAMDYLYCELLYDEEPLLVRIIPFVTINKEKMKNCLKKMVKEYDYDIREYFKLSKNQTIGLKEILYYICGGCTGTHTYVREGILFHFESYVEDLRQDETLSKYTLGDFVDKAAFYRTFTDYKIVRTSEPDKIYLPYSLIEKIIRKSPEWVCIIDENRGRCLQFPYITLESVKMTPIKSLYLYNFETKEVVGTEALKYCQDLSTISIVEYYLEKYEFPAWLTLPKLDFLEIWNSDFGREGKIDLTFLQNSANLEEINIRYLEDRKSKGKKLILPPFEKHALLKEITIEYCKVRKIDLKGLWKCPNLKKINISGNLIETLNLSPLKQCHSLQELVLRGNKMKTLDLSPLKECFNLEILDIRRNMIETIDLSPLQHCTNLKEIILKENLIEEIDLSPLEKCDALEKIILKDIEIEEDKIQDQGYEEEEETYEEL